MRATDLMTAAYCVCIEANREVRDAWIAHSFKLGDIAGAAHIFNAQQNGELDLLLRQLDKEAIGPPDGAIDLSLSFRASMSDCWLLRAYEMVRSADEQIKLRNGKNERVALLKHRMGLVRMPTAKAQIQGKKSETKGRILAHADGKNPKEYTNDGTYMAPRGVCSQTGSAVWLPADAATQKTIQIRRIDLSNELLELFD